MDKKQPPAPSMTNVEPFPIWTKRVLKGYFASLLYTQSPKRDAIKTEKDAMSKYWYYFSFSW
jgi:hypothetical protein